MNLAKCADAVLTTADLLSGRPTELLYSFCSFGSFLFADSFPRAIFPLSAMTALLFHLSVLVIWKFAISQPVYYRAYDFSDNAGQCTHTHRARFFLSLRRCSLCQNAIRRNTYPGHFRSVSSFHNFCVQSWAFHFAKLVTATLSQTPHCDRTTMQNRQTCYAVRTPATISATAAPTTSPTEPPHAPNLVRHSILRMRYHFANSYHQPYWSPVPLIPCFIDLLSHWSPVLLIRYVCIIYTYIYIYNIYVYIYIL